MAKNIVICGYGPGISDAVARRFGNEGFNVGLVARRADALNDAVARLSGQGVTAYAFPADLGKPEAMSGLFETIRQAMGPTTVLHWNATSGAAGDLMTATPDELRAVLDLAVGGLVAAVQASAADLESQEESAVLVTGGGFSMYDDNVDRMIVTFGAMGLGVAKAAQHKVVRLLRARLAAKKVFVGEVTVLAQVKGTAFDNGQATLEPDTVAEAMWNLYKARDRMVAICPQG